MKKTGPPKRPTARRALKATRGVALGCAIIGGSGTGSSIFSDALAKGDPIGCLLAFGVGIVIAAGIATGWHYALGLAAHTEEDGEPEKKAQAVVIAAFLLFVGCGTSGWYLTSRIGGANAEQQHQLEHTQKLAGSADAVKSNSGLDDGLVASVETSASAMRSAAESEREAGLMSHGQRGAGVVYRTLNDAADNMRDMAAKLRDLVASRDNHLKHTLQNLVEARKAAASHDTGHFEEAVARAASEIAAADQTPILATASTLRPGVVTSNSRATIEAAFNDIGRAAGLVAENRREVSVPVYVPIDAKQAVIAHPPILAWVAALLIEGIPLILLAVLLILWRNDDDDSAPPAVESEPRPRSSLVVVK